MYKVQRKQTVVEELQIEDSRGELALSIPVKIRVDDVIGEYNRLRRLLGETQAELMKDPKSEKAMESYGFVVIAFFKLIFGEEGAESLLEFYENRYSEMLSDIAPFIIDRINPAMNAAMQERADKLRALTKKAGK